MKITAICGSPRRGTNYLVLKSIKDKYPDIDFKIIMLNELKIEMCRGCYSCIQKGEQKCPLKDDRDMVINEMKEADGIIFASPVYCNHVSGLMKNFIDRLGFFSHRPEFFEKFAMVMSVCKGFGTEPTNEYMSGILSTFGYNVISSLELQYSTNSNEEKRINNEKVLKKFDMLIQGIKAGERKKPTINQVVMFNLFKFISELDKQHFPADYEFYKDKEEYFYDRKISFFQSKIGNMVVKKFAKRVKA